MVVGDFNIVTRLEEKTGGNPLNTNDVTNFTSMISHCGLSDGGFNGSRFTWSNNRLGRGKILERLDRALLNCQWIDIFLTSVIHLHRACSDHSPVIISFGPTESMGSSFRFLNVCARHHSFKNMVQNFWLTPASGRPITKFAANLKALKEK